MKKKLDRVDFLLIVFIGINLVAFTACQDKTALLVKDSSTSIAEERIGLDGEYDLNGLAKRVAKALEEDPTLQTVETVYVAQNNSQIILKGTISDPIFLERLVTVAQNVRGVSEVDTSQIEIR